MAKKTRKFYELRTKIASDQVYDRVDHMGLLSGIIEIKHLFRVFITLWFFITFLITNSDVQAVFNSRSISSQLNPPLRTEIHFSGRLQEEPERLQTFTLQAPQLRIKDHTIQVYLPPDYSTSKKEYPVLYLHDGGLLFAPPTARDCHFDEVMDQLCQNKQVDGIIMVGIFSDENRWDEYSPWVDNHMFDWIQPIDTKPVEGGEGDAYLDFIIDTVKPEIDSRYRTLPERENTAIGGFSMGGLISLYAGLSRPEVFSMVMAMSPAIWFAEQEGPWLSDNQFLDYVKSIDVPKNVAFYLDIGTNEWQDNPVSVIDSQGLAMTYPRVWLEGAEAAYSALSEANVPEENLILVIDEGGIHEPSSWGERFDEAVKWIFTKEHSVVALTELDDTSAPLNKVITEIPGSGSQVGEFDATPVKLLNQETGDNTWPVLTLGIALLLSSISLLLWLFFKNGHYHK